MDDSVIEVSHLRKTYGDTQAVRDLSLQVHRGEIFGLLGRNGAGKTTTVEIIGGLRRPDSGQVTVLGLDPIRDGARLREQVGLQLQDSQLQPRITVREALDLYASFYPEPADPTALMAELGLTAKAGTRFDRLSGGQRQRLSVALALVGRPQVAILDELTTGLDPHARREAWDLVRQVRASGVTILLVTHLMEEAERLCDRIAVIADGTVVATGTPAELAASARTGRILSFVPDGPVPDGLLDAIPGVQAISLLEGRLVLRGANQMVQDVLVALAGAGLHADDLRLEAPNLEDAFLELTRTEKEVAA
ncbi:MAG: ABC transporter ATP-binding protein [Actinobacteria bacterium]|nr:ABC transporter ATP-binding protein [Actinomycetota bacterium]MCG2801557.1 ABC transporter ATP-binding protein [Cellulomonas sp.]